MKVVEHHGTDVLLHWSGALVCNLPAVLTVYTYAHKRFIWNGAPYLSPLRWRYDHPTQEGVCAMYGVQLCPLWKSGHAPYPTLGQKAPRPVI